jgi:hypothetical protein
MNATSVWTEDVSLPLDFAVRILERDGLRVLPFDVHPDGDGSLRALGLEATTWTAWVNAIVEGERALASTANALEIPLRASEAMDRLTDQIRDRETPWKAITGSDQLRMRLGALWGDYREEGARWQHTYALTRRHVHMAPENQRLLSRALERLPGAPQLSVFVVRYSSPVVMILPPDVCIVGRSYPDRGGRTFSGQIQNGARALAAHRDH